VGELERMSRIEAKMARIKDKKGKAACRSGH